MNAPPIFVGGCPRSGTTLLRAILDSHPSIVCGPELRAFPSLAGLSSDMRRLMGETLASHYHLPASDLDKVFAKLMTSFVEPLRARAGKRRVAEKTPANALHFGELARLFPDSHFVQIVRDGRDVVSSLLGMDWKDDRTGRSLPITADAGAAARSWREHVVGGRAAAASGARYLELRYERLIWTTETQLRALFSFLDEPWSEDALSFHRRDRGAEGVNETSATRISGAIDGAAIGRWRSDISPSAKSAIKAEAGALLIELGYADDDRW